MFVDTHKTRTKKIEMYLEISESTVTEAFDLNCIDRIQ